MRAEPQPTMPTAFAALHRDAVGMLETWTAPTPALDATASRMTAFLGAEPAAMWRQGGGVHFTASTVVLTPDLTQVALTLHAKAKRWFQFGGHFEEQDADVAAAALREATEESGLQGLDLLPGLLTVDAHELPGAFGQCREHLDLRFVAVAVSPDELACSDESDDVAWWSIDALPHDTDDSLRDAIHRAQSAARFAGYGV